VNSSLETAAPDRTSLPIYVGPKPVPRLEEAVVAAGGHLVPLPQAAGLVYYGSDDPGELESMLHPRIRWVQLPHAGIEPWNNAGLIRDDRVWTCAAGAYGAAVAEHALALMLLAARRLHELSRAHHWSSTKRTRMFAGSTVALIGMGGIGRALIGMLQPFGCRVLAVSDRGGVAGAAVTVPRSNFRDVVAEGHYVVLAAPSTPRTRGMISASELALMRPDAWLVNAARGDLVVTADLVDALKRSAIGGAALDVVDSEPLPDGHPLWHLPNALVTPHCANPDSAYWDGLAARVGINVERLASGQPLEGVVRATAGY
jgi:phosphoglycerate dehydrogenase-like enzyme